MLKLSAKRFWRLSGIGDCLSDPLLAIPYCLIMDISHTLGKGQIQRDCAELLDYIKSRTSPASFCLYLRPDITEDPQQTLMLVVQGDMIRQLPDILGRILHRHPKACRLKHI